METIVFGGGCFWCTEAVFSRIKGVEKVNSGYAGGEMDNPNYEQVSTGMTGQAEVIKIEFDPKIISLKQLMKILKEIFDLTQVNRQGNDTGNQYRSLILYTNENQKLILEKFKRDNPKIVTEIAPLEKFYKAEEYHQKYFEKNPQLPYCSLVIGPKLKHLEEKYAEWLKM